jgi:hypothetical protein
MDEKGNRGDAEDAEYAQRKKLMGLLNLLVTLQDPLSISDKDKLKDLELEGANVYFPQHNTFTLPHRFQTRRWWHGGGL